MIQKSTLLRYLSFTKATFLTNPQLLEIAAAQARDQESPPILSSNEAFPIKTLVGEQRAVKHAIGYEQKGESRFVPDIKKNETYSERNNGRNPETDRADLEIHEVNIEGICK